MDSVIQVEGLVKNFKETRALDGVDLTARRGTVLGLLGPNGSGKTTTVRVLATLLRPDGGRAGVLGHDVVADAPAVRRRIGLTGQYAAVDEALSGVANLVLVGRLLDMPRRAARARGGRADRAVRPRRGGSARGRARTRRDATAARPGSESDRPSRGAVPGRTDHRPRPAVPQRGGTGVRALVARAPRCC